MEGVSIPDNSSHSCWICYWTLFPVQQFLEIYIFFAWCHYGPWGLWLLIQLILAPMDVCECYHSIIAFVLSHCRFYSISWFHVSNMPSRRSNVREETIWRTYPRPGQPRGHHQRLHHQNHRPREPVWDLRLCPDPPSAVILSPCGAGLVSYPRRQQQVPVYVVKLFRLSSSSWCKKFHVDRVFILVYNAFMMMKCSCSHAVHVYKMFMLPRHLHCQNVHVVRVFMMIEFLY